MVVIEVGEFVVDGMISGEPEALLRVNSTFHILVEQLTIIDEPSFPILELAKSLRSWEAHGSYEYQSMEADVSPLLFVETKSGYYVASPLSRTCSDVIVNRNELLYAVRSFIEKIRREISSRGLPQLI